MSELDDNIAASERVTAYLRSLQGSPPIVTDNTAQVQAALNKGGLVTLSPGRYFCNGLTIKSGTRFYSPGVILEALPTLPPDRSLLWNANFGGGDGDIVIDGLTFEGANLARTQPLVFLIGTKNSQVINSTVQNTGYIGLGLANGDNNAVISCSFAHTGNPIETEEGGAAIWVGETSGQTTNTDIIDCVFHDLEWSAIYLVGRNSRVIGCSTLRTKESAIFIGNTCPSPLIKGNSITTTRTKHISASGIESGASGATIEGNVIIDVGNGCIDLMDTSSVTVRDNICRNPGQETRFSSFAGCIQIVTMPGSAPSSNIVIVDNLVSCNTPVRGIAFDRQAGAPVVNDVLVTGNNAAGSTWTSAFYAAPGMLGSNCVTSPNTGF